MTDLRTGLSTGTCAAAAAKAAVLMLCGKEVPERIQIALPDAEQVDLPLAFARKCEGCAEAGVQKDAGDDPDITHGALITVAARWTEENDVSFAAGKGVGTVTLPGLPVPPGEPAINPVPRKMMRFAVREVTDRGVCLTVSIPNGRDLAQKTFNPKLGIVGGLSILGTTGRVRPFSAEALESSLICALKVSRGTGVRAPVLVPGHMGRRAALRHFVLSPRQVVEVSNFWKAMLRTAETLDFERVLILGHPGKLAKLAQSHWNTHSSHSKSAAPWVRETLEGILGEPVEDLPTVEGLFAALPRQVRQTAACAVAEQVRAAVIRKTAGRFAVAVALIDMAENILGTAGDTTPWR